MLIKYLHRLYDMVNSRGDVDIEELTFKKHSKRHGTIKGSVRFYDGSLLQFREVVVLHNRRLQKRDYAYHYQNSANELIFRYDNAPHHPHIPTYPHHKHVGSKLESALPPDLNEVLHEIEQIIYES